MEDACVYMYVCVCVRACVRAPVCQGCCMHANASAVTCLCVEMLGHSSPHLLYLPPLSLLPATHRQRKVRRGKTQSTRGQLAGGRRHLHPQRLGHRHSRWRQSLPVPTTSSPCWLCSTWASTCHALRCAGCGCAGRGWPGDTSGWQPTARFERSRPSARYHA